MTNLSDWLKPTILGPLFVTWGLATLGAVASGMSAVLWLGFMQPAWAAGAGFDQWLLGMLFASFFGSGLAVLLVTADLVLLKWQVRSLPTGGRAWLSSLLAPFAVF